MEVDGKVPMSTKLHQMMELLKARLEKARLENIPANNRCQVPNSVKGKQGR